MFSPTHLAETSGGVVGPLSLSSLISCLEERIAVMHQVGAAVEIGGFPELLEHAVQHLLATSSLEDDLKSRLRV